MLTWLIERSSQGWDAPIVIEAELPPFKTGEPQLRWFVDNASLKLQHHYFRIRTKA